MNWLIILIVVYLGSNLAYTYHLLHASGAWNDIAEGAPRAIRIVSKIMLSVVIYLLLLVGIWVYCLYFEIIRWKERRDWSRNHG
jgi:type IV secretory pathway TrbD component